jgi:hypothetical protein
MDFFNYDDYFFDIYSNKFIIENENILSINQDKYNILNDFNHIIKKLNLNIYIISENKYNFDFLKTITEEDTFSINIKIFNNFEHENSFPIFNKIIIFQINSLENLENILDKIFDCSDFNTNIIIYCSLSNEKLKNINYKNKLRYYVSDLLKSNIGFVYSFSDVVSKIENIKKANYKFKIESIDVYRKNNYIIYGNNVVYEIHLVKIEENI